jgi:CRP-like cAMP-binding protein
MTSNLLAHCSPKQNDILAYLPAQDYERLLPNLELIEMPLGLSIYESGKRLSHAYFPTSAIVSLLYVTESGSSTEIAVTGFDGIVGIALFMGGNTTTSRAVVQSAGFAYRLKAAIMKREFLLGGNVQKLALSYTQALITQMAQTAVCNRHHTVDQQLCRWLLLSHDLLRTNELKMTQELIANMLGVRRGGVTEAAGKLQSEGLIQYGRGSIKILNRRALEKRACECYAAVRKEYDRILPDRQKHRHHHTHMFTENKNAGRLHPNASYEFI